MMPVLILITVLMLVCFVQAAPFLDKSRVSIFPALSSASIHQWFDGSAQVIRFKHFVEVVWNWVAQADSVCLGTACLQGSPRQSPWSRAYTQGDLCLPPGPYHLCSFLGKLSNQLRREYNLIHKMVTFLTRHTTDHHHHQT